MMRMSRHLLCLTLILCLLVSGVSMTAAAQEPNGLIPETAERGGMGEVSWRNPAYPQDGASGTAENSMAGELINRELYYSDFTTREYVVKELNQAMIERKNEIYLYYQTTQPLTEADLAALMEDALMLETDSVWGGDYLALHVIDYMGVWEPIIESGIYYNVVGFGVAYSTTSEQEGQLTDQIYALRSEICDGMLNEYQKVKSIYDYIMTNVEYDLENLEDLNYILQHTGYAALLDGKASAIGYSLLFYRMANEYGLDAELIAGTIDGNLFIWNVVKLYGQWYQINLGMDALTGSNECFLFGLDDMSAGHVLPDEYLTPEFQAEYPFAKTHFIPEQAGSGTAGEAVTWSYDAASATLTFSGSGKMADQKTEWGATPWFDYIDSGAHVVIGEGITYIGASSFWNRNLQSLQLPDSLEVIGSGAFSTTSGLKELTLPKNVKTIEQYAFYSSELESIKLPDGLTEIGKQAFADSSKLTAIELPESLTTIGDNAFYNVPMKEVRIPANVSNIGRNVFFHEELTAYYVDEKNAFFSSYSGALYNKDQTVLLEAPYTLGKDFTFSDSLTTISDNAFALRNGENMKLPEGLTSIGKEAFAGGYNRVVELPESMTVIGEAAFHKANLYSIYIPATVSKIEKQVFQSGSLEIICYGGTQEQWDAIIIEEENDLLESAELYTDTHTVAGSGWTLDLSNGSMMVDQMYDCSGGPQPWHPWNASIKTVEFGQHVYPIYEYSFAGYENLKTIHWNCNNSSVYENAFAGCTGLMDVYYNESESKWKEEGLDKIFPDSPNLTVHFKALPVSGSWGDNGKWSYDEKTGLLEISGQGVITRDNRGWDHWADYVKVAIIEEGVTEIGYSAFYGCYDLIQIVIPEGVTSIGQYAFHATSLNDITIPLSLQSVDAEALIGGETNRDIHYKGTEAQWNAIQFGENNVGFTHANIHFETTCDHDMFIDMGKEATCTEEGLSMSKYCKTCNTVFAEQRVLPKAAHESSYGGCNFCGEDVFAERSFEGEFADGLTWSFNRYSNELTVFGEGEIPDFAGSSATPWSEWTTDIKSIWVNGGITRIGSYAFSDCVNIGHISANENLTSIGTHAFDGCVQMNYVTIPGGVKTIEAAAFKNCNLTQVYYRGSERTWNTMDIGSENESLLLAKRTYESPVEYVPNPFTDVSVADWFANPVLWAYNTGITGGTSATTFGPNNSCTRAQVVTFLYAAAGKPEVTVTDNPFEDVAADAWYLKPVLWAVENGITSGVDATHFGPDNTCTRAQVVTFLYAAAGKPEIKAEGSEFNDVADSDWFVKPVMWAKENDVTGGISEGMFGPNQTCTRAQVVTFLYKVYG